jgi:hypothetical protein
MIHYQRPPGTRQQSAIVSQRAAVGVLQCAETSPPRAGQVSDKAEKFGIEDRRARERSDGAPGAGARLKPPKKRRKSGAVQAAKSARNPSDPVLKFDAPDAAVRNCLPGLGVAALPDHLRHDLSHDAQSRFGHRVLLSSLPSSFLAVATLS